MSDIATARSALASSTTYPGGGPLRLAEGAGRTLLHLEGSRPGTDLDAVLAMLGLAELPSIGTSAGTNDARLLCCGPSIWLLMLEATGTTPHALVLTGPVGRAFTAVLDLSHAYTRVEIAGAKATELLAKGCAVDLHPDAFPPGACAATGIGGIRTILWHTLDQDCFELLVTRSYAVSLWEWLLDAAAEYRAT